MKAGISGLIALLLVAAAAWLAIALQEAPRPEAGAMPPGDFSSARAMVDVEAIAERPHPIGSADHARVRDYIVQRMRSLGVEPELQETTAVFAKDGVAGRVTNILARRKGTANTRAVLLSAHYDSVAAGPGAADDASAVASLLETLRALRSRPALRNDVIVLITDGEEAGLLGAAAFTAEHPWAKEVGVVLNFDARGNRGPVLMFETTPGNSQLIALMRDHVRDPRSSSLTQAVYQYLPNDTDLTVFKQAGLNGLNFAFIGNLEAYHTRLDTPQNLSRATLEHQGNYALALARAAADAKLPLAARDDASYFNTIGSGFIVYPLTWVTTLTVGGALFALIVLVLAFRRDQVTFGSLALAALVAPVTVGASTGLAFLMIGAARWAHSHLVAPGPILLSGWYAATIVAIALVVTIALIATLRRWVTGTALAVGALIWWIALAVVTAHWLPGGNFLFLWPALLLSLAIVTELWWAPGTAPGIVAQILSLGFVLLAVVLVAPVVYSFHVAFPLNGVGTVVLAVLASIALMLIAEPLYRSVAAFGWWVAGGAALLVLILFAGGLSTTRYGSEHPRVANLLYLFDADAGRAYWAARESTSNEWTQEVLTGSPDRGLLPAFFSQGTTPWLYHDAPVAELPAPSVNVVKDETDKGRRRLSLHVRANRPAWQLRVRASGAAIAAATVNARHVALPESEPAAGSNEWSLRFFNPADDGIWLTLEVEAGKPLALRAVAYSLGLPALAAGAAPPRPVDLMPNHDGDLTLVARSLQIPAQRK
ncbi:MAG: M28 family peptidase [Steroidobacteraceae bacterium]